MHFDFPLKNSPLFFSGRIDVWKYEEQTSVLDWGHPDIKDYMLSGLCAVIFQHFSHKGHEENGLEHPSSWCLPAISSQAQKDPVSSLQVGQSLCQHHKEIVHPPPHTHTYRKCLTHGFLTQHQCQIILFYPLKTFTEKFTARSYYSWLITCIFIKIEWNFLLKCHQNNIKWVGFYRFLSFHTIRWLYLKLECFTLLPLQVQILIFRFDQNFLAEFKVQLEIQAK